MGEGHMDRKRSMSGEEESPSVKQLKSEHIPTKREDFEQMVVDPLGVFSASFGGKEGTDEKPEWGKVLLLQRNQLCAKAKEQAVSLTELKKKMEGLQDRVSHMEADSRTAISQLTSVQEDLTLTLARLGAEGEDIDAEETSSDVAEAILSGDGFSGMHSELLAAKSDATKRLLAQIVELLEDRIDSALEKKDETMRKANAELHARLRRSNDNLTKATATEIEVKRKVQTLSDEVDDLKAALDRRRNRIVMLVSQKAHGKPEKPEAATEKPKPPREDGSNHENEIQDLKYRVDGLLKELEDELKHRKELTEKLEKANQARETPNMQEILSSALYQTMEANLQELVLKEQQWKQEQETIAREKDDVISQYEASLSFETDNYNRRVELLERQLTEATKSAEQAKAFKDKISLQYESRKVDVNLELSKALLEQQLDDLRTGKEKLEKAHAELKKNYESTRKRLDEAEKNIAAGFKFTEADEMGRLRRDLETEKKNSDSLYEEMEALSNELAEREKEKADLESKYKESTTSLRKEQKERLKLRQQVISVKEEGKTMQLRLKSEEEQNKSLQALLASSRQLAMEAQKVSSKCQEEMQLLEGKADTLRDISENFKRRMTQALAETEELKNAKSNAQARVVTLSKEVEQEKFNTKRLEDQVAVLTRRLNKKELERNSDDSSAEFSKEELLREYRKIRNCSVKTDKPKEVALLRCGHLFSRQCVDDLVAARNRKCPICGEKFSNDDVRPIYFS